jgi:hypothetical protein
MPFPDQQPRPFTKPEVQKLHVGQRGCYGLFNSSVWIYVGMGDIRSRLLAHLNGDDSCITQWAPTHFVQEITTNMDEREKELIRELSPKCNMRVG